MSLLLHPDYLTKKRNEEGAFTAAEIEQQPVTWRETWEKIISEPDQLSSFLHPLRTNKQLNIVLTGAGSSAFIGDALTGVWLQSFSSPTQAIPTTDLVTHFSKRVAVDKPLLLISFARSGNSPESTAAIERANNLCGEVYHLIITCNAGGKLARMGDQDNTCVFLMPPEAEDQSLAMTNSFTSMTLAAALIPSVIPNVAAKQTGNIDRQVDLLT